MKLRKAAYENYRGIQNRVEVDYGNTSIFVGRNDAGKSTLLRGLDLFLNNTEALPDIANAFSDSDICSIELAFDEALPSITIDEAIPTTFEAELLLDENGQLRIKKEWDTKKSQIKPVTYIRRKSFGDEDFLLETERQLITRCQANGIETQKANGDEFNNPEKREKLRERFVASGKETTFVWEKLPTSGSNRAKQIHDQVKAVLPSFEYFRADTALSEADASIQKHFRGIASKAMIEAGIGDVEKKVRAVLDGVLEEISTKMNQVLPDSDQVGSSVIFDWSKGVSTGFKSVNDQAALPLTFRGDGFRRITMMSYFEYLAEERAEIDQKMIFGFEEPETFLHPKAQEQLHDKILGLEQSGYQVVVTTHSPTVVGASDTSTISHIISEPGNYNVEQNTNNIQAIADDLGITPDNQFIKLFERAKVLVLVEGPDDVGAFNYMAQLYKDEGRIPATFEDQDIVLVPIGGCDSVMHWVNLNILRDLDKPYYAIQDSDRGDQNESSPTRDKLLELGFSEPDDFWVLRKRALENYINKRTLERLIPGIEIEYDDFTKMKPLCGQHSSAVSLGGKKVVDKHFQNQSFTEIEESFRDEDGNDEFINIYEQVCRKL
ncbi:ATP-dependent nuclease [Microbulbifer sp. ANSA003]|uniref:ATP-dependent nuclease n=1 Tax=Microbulbifer sp. ANSA003 TaxID=3243360 RepID=UPI0040425F51